MERIGNHTGLMAKCWVKRGVSTSSSAELICRPQATHVADDRGDTGATNSHPHLLQPEGARATLGLPPEDQELLLDGDGVHGAVFLPLGVDAARVPAPGLCDLGGVSVGVPGDAAGGAGRSRW